MKAVFFSFIIVKEKICQKGDQQMLDDKQIVDLYWARSEEAITETVCQKFYRR